MGKVPYENQSGGPRDLCKVGEACDWLVWEWIDQGERVSPMHASGMISEGKLEASGC